MLSLGTPSSIAAASNMSVKTLTLNGNTEEQTVEAVAVSVPVATKEQAKTSPQYLRKIRVLLMSLLKGGFGDSPCLVY